MAKGSADQSRRMLVIRSDIVLYYGLESKSLDAHINGRRSSRNGIVRLVFHLRIHIGYRYCSVQRTPEVGQHSSRSQSYLHAISDSEGKCELRLSVSQSCS